MTVSSHSGEGWNLRFFVGAGLPSPPLGLRRIMFQFLQNHTKKILMVICIPIILSFVLYFNVGTLQNNEDNNPVIAEMFGTPVSFLDFQKAYQAVVKQEEALRYGVPMKSLNPYMKQEEQAFFRLMLLKKVKDLNVLVNDQELQEELVKTFTNLPGKDQTFNVQWYEDFIVSNLRITPGEFEAMMRDSIAIEKLAENIQAGVTLSDSEAERLYQEENTGVEFSYAELTSNAFENQVLIDEKGLEDFYNQNPEQFAIPTEVKLQYIYSKNERFKDKINVSDQDIQKYYAENQDTFKATPEKNAEGPVGIQSLDAVKEDINKIITQEKCHAAAEAHFENLYRQMSEKNNFDAVVKENLETVIATDFFQSERVPPGFGGPSSQQVRDALALTIDDFCGPYEYLDGFLIFKIADKKESKLPGSWKEVREVVEQQYRVKEAPALALKEAEMLRQKVLGVVPRKTFEEVLKENGITANHSGSITKRSQFVPGIGYCPAILEKVFALKEDEISELLPLNQGKGFIFAQITKRIPAEMSHYTFERESFKNQMLHSKKMKIFVEWLQTVQKEANLKRIKV
jgi:peptidyl-prolyl cis-trans isomerase D